MSIPVLWNLVNMVILSSKVTCPEGQWAFIMSWRTLSEST